MSQVAFNTANLVGRVTGYRFELRHWGRQHARTVAETDSAAWAAICAEIAVAGFRAVEIWEAHASPERLKRPQDADLWRRITEDAGLQPVAYAGHLSRETIEICRHLRIPHIDGGIGGLSPDAATALCTESGVGFNFENHPEKSAREIVDAVGGGNPWLGVCIDTGWLGTQGVPAADAIREIGDRVRHVHVKDVRAAGGHDTCLLGDGVVGIEAVLDALREIDYAGWYSWEDEPEDRNPFDSAVRNRQWLESRLVA